MKRTIKIKAKDTRGHLGLVEMAIEVKAVFKGENPDKIKRSTELLRDQVFAFVSEYFHVSEIKLQ